MYTHKSLSSLQETLQRNSRASIDGRFKVIKVTRDRLALSVYFVRWNDIAAN